MRALRGGVQNRESGIGLRAKESFAYPPRLLFLCREFATSEPASSLASDFHVDIPESHGTSAPSPFRPVRRWQFRRALVHFFCSFSGCAVCSFSSFE